MPAGPTLKPQSRRKLANRPKKTRMMSKKSCKISRNLKNLLIDKKPPVTIYSKCLEVAKTVITTS